MKRKKKQAENFLDYIPMKNEEYKWDKNESGLAVVQVVNKGFYPMLAQKFFHKPRISYIDLDLYGTFVWEQIDGVNTIYDISKKVEQQFGKDAEPVTERLVQFFRILQNHTFIKYKGK